MTSTQEPDSRFKPPPGWTRFRRRLGDPRPSRRTEPKRSAPWLVGLVWGVFALSVGLLVAGVMMLQPWQCAGQAKPCSEAVPHPTVALRMMAVGVAGLAALHLRYAQAVYVGWWYLATFGHAPEWVRRYASSSWFFAVHNVFGSAFLALFAWALWHM
jgi:hypothetical protein